MLGFSFPPPARLQELTPRQAKFCLQILRFIEKDLGLSLAGRHLLAGFSGGADSTALLLALCCLSEKLGCSLSAAHLDHRLRPSSGQELEQCGEFCAHLGIPFYSGRFDVAACSGPRKPGIEEAARNARYDFYRQTATRETCDWIVTGHTLNDLAEDQLMRMIRGTGWPALSGMQGLDAGRKLFRPLLLTPRSSIETFLSSLGVSWIEDESNQEMTYFRNRVRKHVLPLMLRENPAFLEKTAGLWKLGQLDKEWITASLPKASPESIDREPVLFQPRSSLENLPKALRLRSYKEALAAVGPGQAHMDSLLALDTAFMMAKKKTIHQFQGAKLAIVDKRGIFWKSQGDSSPDNSGKNKEKGSLPTPPPGAK